MRTNTNTLPQQCKIDARVLTEHTFAYKFRAYASALPLHGTTYHLDKQGHTTRGSDRTTHGQCCNHKLEVVSLILPIWGANKRLIGVGPYCAQVVTATHELRCTRENTCNTPQHPTIMLVGNTTTLLLTVLGKSDCAGIILHWHQCMHTAAMQAASCHSIALYECV